MWRPPITSLEKLGVSGEKNLIGINVSASVKWKTKNWPVASIIRLIELLGENFLLIR